MATLTRAGLADALHRKVGLTRSETAEFVEDGGAGVRAGRRRRPPAGKEDRGANRHGPAAALGAG